MRTCESNGTAAVEKGRKRAIRLSRNGQANLEGLRVRPPADLNSKSQALAVKKARQQLADELALTVCDATGTQSYEMADRIIAQVANAHIWPKPGDTSDGIIKAVTAIREMAPRNVTEAMLAAQMIATNEAALKFLRHATQEDQYAEAADASVLRATRLMRVFTEQLEAMQRLKGKAGQQKVIVEHVHVHQGGQAIVGSVTANGTDRGVGDDREDS